MIENILDRAKQVYELLSEDPACSAQAKEVQAPVSYTHLDVYKRQG